MNFEDYQKLFDWYRKTDKEKIFATLLRFIALVVRQENVDTATVLHYLEELGMDTESD